MNKVPAFLSHATKQKQLKLLSSMANDIIDIYVLEQSQAIPNIYEDTDYMERQLESLQSSDEDQKFKCPKLTEELSAISLAQKAHERKKNIELLSTWLHHKDQIPLKHHMTEFLMLHLPF